MTTCYYLALTRKNFGTVHETWLWLRDASFSEKRRKLLTPSARLWFAIVALSFCLSCAGARAQQQNPFAGMVKGLDLSPMNVGAVPIKDVTKNNCGSLNKLDAVRTDAITPSLSSRISKQIHTAVDAFGEKAASHGKQTGVQQLVGTYDKLLGDSKAIALRELTAIRPLLWSSL